MSTVRIAQVGGRGFGRIHLERIDRMVAAGRAALVALADPAGPVEGLDCAWYAGLDELLANHEVDVVSIATPINTHAALADMAMRAGADVMLEKPPVASMTEFFELMALAHELGRTVQIGFQSFGSHGIGRMQQLMDGAELGQLQRVEVYGAWTRNRAYYARSAWAGKRTANGHRVADGVCTNPLAHAIATACRITGLENMADVAEIATELYHAHDIDADDTSWLQIRPQPGSGHLPITVALCLTAEDEMPPYITLVGERGRARYEYTEDLLELTVDGATTIERFERDCLLENLLDHLADRSVELLVPLACTGVFMAALEATQDRPEPAAITDHVEWVGEGPQQHPVVEDVKQWMARALESGQPYSELGAPWADESALHVWRPRTVLHTLAVDGAEVAELYSGDDIIAGSSPRPYLSLRTLGGQRVSDAHPADHDWHCGLSLTMPDVNGVNFWGGRTFVRGVGYTGLPDHGRIDQVEVLEAGEGSLTTRLRWSGPTEQDAAAPEPVELTERRSMTWRGVDAQTWRLDLAVDLAAVTPAEVSLGGPGTNGRDVGYGGLQLRLPASRPVRVWSDRGEGADALQGKPANWVAYAFEVDGRTATVVMSVTDQGPDDVWFVRDAEFQGLGTALAWSQRLPLPIHRHHVVLVADGLLDDDAVRSALGK